MALALRDPEYHTYGDYLRWPEDVRYELIDGQAYLMAPAPTLDHQVCVGEIFRQLANALGNLALLTIRWRWCRRCSWVQPM